MSVEPLSATVGLDEESARWLARLQASGVEQDQAVRDLRTRLLRVARAECARRRGLSGVDGPELDDLAEQAASDATLSVCRRLDTFRGDSRFLTWAYAFVVFEVSGKLGRHAWRRDGVRWEAADWAALPDRLGASPADVVEGRELVAAVRAAVEHDLTPRQREVFVAIIVNGSPLDAVVAELGTSRNAVYKMMYDARQRLRRSLVTGGFLDGGAS